MSRSLRCHGVAWTLVLGALAHGAETSDPALIAAQRALSAGQPIAAIQVLDGHPASAIPGDVRLLRARAYLVLGRSGDAASTLAVRALDDLTQWPERLRGAVAVVNGEILLAASDIAGARAWLEHGLRSRGTGVEVDRTLILLAEACERLGDVETARRSAHVVWRDWPRSVHRARAGVIEARLLAVTQPDEARALLAGVRALDQVEPGTRLLAAELLCQLLLISKPGQCLVVAEQETARLTMQHGRLPLYRALALAALDPRDGRTAIDALPPPLRDDPAASAARTRLSSVSGDQQDVALLIERARAEIDLGRSDQARVMLEPLAASQPAALILLAGMPKIALDPWLQSPAMSDRSARLAVAIALSRRGDHQRAWALFSTVLEQDRSTGEEIPLASVLFWAERSARQVAPERVSGLTSRLLALTGEGVELGLAWAEEAQRRERAGASAEETRQAWQRAGEALPATHAWQPLAILRAVRPLIQADREWETARRLLERVAIVGGNDEHRRCRFLLAQVYEHLGLVTQALQVVGELRIVAGPEQAEKLDRMHVRLTSHTASEVQPGPLDAEN